LKNKAQIWRGSWPGPSTPVELRACNQRD